MKIMDGANLQARLNVAATSLFDSPTHLFKILDSLIGIKTALLSLATALASIVFPVPKEKKYNELFSSKEQQEN